MTMASTIAAAALALGFAAFPPRLAAQADTNSRMDEGTKKMMKSTDVTFAMKAAQGGMAEVEMGKLAAEKATNPDVKAFGQQMVDDHTKANDDLKATAAKLGMTLPTNLNAKDQAEYLKLQRVSGAAFDREYVRDMVRDHEEDVKEFQKEANNGQDSELKLFASRTLPVLEQHLSKIKSVQSSVQGGPAK